MGGARCGNRAFALELAASIHVQGHRLVIFDITTRFATVKNVVSGVMHEHGIDARSFFRQYLRRFGIHRHCRRALSLGTIHRGIRRRIDNQGRLHRPHFRHNRISVGEIKFGAAAGDNRPRRSECMPQFSADLPVATGEQNRPHAYTGASLSNLPTRSLGDNCGSVLSGHAIASAGSFQSMQCSDCGA